MEKFNTSNFVGGDWQMNILALTKDGFYVQGMVTNIKGCIIVSLLDYKGGCYYQVDKCKIDMYKVID